MREAAELAQPTEEYSASPLDDNLFEWHFTVRGPPTSEFEGGIYHGRILLPSEYPMKPPDIILLTVIIIIKKKLTKPHQSLHFCLISTEIIILQCF